MTDQQQELGSGNSEASSPTSLLRGLFFVTICFVVLSVFLSLEGDTTAQENRQGEPDFPRLFREVDRRLEQSYLDLDRAKPRPLVERALSQLELAADEIYVERFDPTKPYVTLHVDDKVDVLNLNNLRTRRDAVDALETVFEFLSRNYRGEKTLNELRYAAQNGFLEGIDPHTVVFTPQSFEDFEIHIKGEIYGVGMMVGQNDQGRLQVKQVLKGTPAARAGFKKDDILAKIADESTINMTVPEAVQRIRGPKGAEIILTVKRKDKEKDETQTIPIAVKRDRVIIKSVESKLIEKWDTENQSKWKGGVGYIKVKNFDQNTTPTLILNLNKLETQNRGPLAGLVLDFRGNSGGLLTQAISMCDLFLKKGDIVITAKKGDRLLRTAARDDDVEPEYPIIMLSDEQSASGAEIVLGALQKNGRGIVLGTRSFGKGSVQQLQELPYGAQLKVTVSEYLIPGDISIQETGVTPDILAQEIVAEDNFTNLFFDERRIGESDYDTHIVSKYKRDETPGFELKYLYRDQSEDDEPSLSERFIAGELAPERDALVQIALRLLREAPKPLNVRSFVADHTEGLKNLREDLLKEVTKKLSKFEIDWSPSKDSPAAKSGAVDVSLSYELVDEASEDKEDPVPVRKIVLRAKAKNTTKETLHRVSGRTQSAYYVYEDREFLFGRIEPGQTVERVRKLALPYFRRAQNTDISLEIKGEQDQFLASAKTEISLPNDERPAFAYSAKLTDVDGNQVDKLKVGKDYKLTLDIENTGGGTAHKGVAIIRNKTGRQVFLKSGRKEFTELKAGKKTSLAFTFDVREGEAVDAYKLELVIYDSYSGETLSRDLEVISRGEKGPNFENGVVYGSPRVKIYASEKVDGERVLVTDREEIQLKALVESRTPSFSAWVTSLAISKKRSTPDKVYFRSSTDDEKLEIKTSVTLSPGVNVITIVAKDANGLLQQASIAVRRRMPPAPEVGVRSR